MQDGPNEKNYGRDTKARPFRKPSSTRSRPYARKQDSTDSSELIPNLGFSHTLDHARDYAPHHTPVHDRHPTHDHVSIFALANANAPAAVDEQDHTHNSARNLEQDRAITDTKNNISAFAIASPYYTGYTKGALRHPTTVPDQIHASAPRPRPHPSPSSASAAPPAHLGARDQTHKKEPIRLRSVSKASLPKGWMLSASSDRITKIQAAPPKHLQLRTRPHLRFHRRPAGPHPVRSLQILTRYKCWMARPKLVDNNKGHRHY